MGQVGMGLKGNKTKTSKSERVCRGSLREEGVCTDGGGGERRNLEVAQDEARSNVFD